MRGLGRERQLDTLTRKKTSLTRSGIRCHLWRIKEEVKIGPIHAYRVRHFHPPFTEIYQNQSISISSDFHRGLMLKGSNQILVKLVLVS